MLHYIRQDSTTIFVIITMVTYTVMHLKDTNLLSHLKAAAST
jgi:hypothetical protein